MDLSNILEDSIAESRREANKNKIKAIELQDGTRLPEDDTYFKLVFNNLTKSDGSALISQKQTIVQAAAYGPIDVALSKTNYEEAVIEVLFKRKVSMSMSNPSQAEMREIENFIKTTFQYVLLTRMHPRTLVSIIVQEIYDGGSIVSAAITSACCALLDCGLPMRCVAAAVTVVTQSNNDEQFKSDSKDIHMEEDDENDHIKAYKFIVQPTKEQETNCCARFDLVFENHSFKLIAIKTQGKYHQSVLKEAIRLARLESEKIFDQIRSHIRSRFLNRVTH